MSHLPFDNPLINSFNSSGLGLGVSTRNGFKSFKIDRVYLYSNKMGNKYFIMKFNKTSFRSPAWVATLCSQSVWLCKNLTVLRRWKWNSNSIYVVVSAVHQYAVKYGSTEYDAYCIPWVSTGNITYRREATCPRSQWCRERWDYRGCCNICDRNTISTETFTRPSS